VTWVKTGLLVIDEREQSALLAAARQAAGNAYCPYSKFPVGAAILTDRGEVFAGCNVENASYGLTICAERSAVFQAIARSSGPLRIRAVLVYTPTRSPAAPCGACRQVLNEFGPSAGVLCVCDGPDKTETTLEELLPQAFGPHNLTT
jgi:cytidine deaminase